MFQEGHVRVKSTRSIISQEKIFCLSLWTGKSTVCQKIVEALQPKEGNEHRSNRVAVIAMENFYRPKTAEQREKALRGNYNLDHPSAFDEKLLLKTLEDLLQGQTVKVTKPFIEENRSSEMANLDCSI